MSEQLIVRALTVKQDGRVPLFVFFLKGKDLLRVADISRIKKDASGELLGYQRGRVARHVDEICTYLQSKDVLFPNAIILAMSSAVKFKQSRGPSANNSESLAGWLEIPLIKGGPKTAWIVDGQQRTLALSSSQRTDLEVPVTAFISDDFEVHRSQFLLVNKVKPLPNGLINELLPVVNTALPPSLAKNKIPSAICYMLNKDPESPFCQLIIRQTTERKTDKKAVIVDNSVIQVIRTSLNSVHGCLYQYKNVATGEIDVECILKVINVFWGEVKTLFPEAWGIPATKSRLMGGAGMKAMGVLMDRIMNSIDVDLPEAGKHIRTRLAPIKPYCAWTQGTWDQLNGMAWNHLQNTAGHVKLLSNMLIRVYAGMEK